MSEVLVADGDVVLVGTRLTPPGDNRGFLARVATDGTLVAYTEHYLGSGFGSAAALPDGGVVVASASGITRFDVLHEAVWSAPVDGLVWALAADENVVVAVGNSDQAQVPWVGQFAVADGAQLSSTTLDVDDVGAGISFATLQNVTPTSTGDFLATGDAVGESGTLFTVLVEPGGEAIPALHWSDGPSGCADLRVFDAGDVLFGVGCTERLFGLTPEGTIAWQGTTDLCVSPPPPATFCGGTGVGILPQAQLVVESNSELMRYDAAGNFVCSTAFGWAPWQYAVADAQGRVFRIHVGIQKPDDVGSPPRIDVQPYDPI